jgi:hypothetical protein
MFQDFMSVFQDLIPDLKCHIEQVGLEVMLKTCTEEVFGFNFDLTLAIPSEGFRFLQYH